MRERQLHLLRQIAHKPRTLFQMTNGAIAETTSARHVENWLAELLDDGYIELRGARYHATEDGIEQAAKPSTIAPGRIWGPCSTKGLYVPPKTYVRAGADQHRQFASKGTV